MQLELVDETGLEELLQLFAAGAERLLECRVGPREKAVERDGDVEDDLGHRSWSTNARSST
jgi:hypothetical protein